MGISILRRMVFGAGCLAIGAAQALDQQAGGIPVGPLVAYPSVTVTLSHDDNQYNAANNEEGSWITVISPGVRFKGERGRYDFAVEYGLDVGRYDNDSTDNYEDQRLAGEFNVGFSQRSRLNLNAEYLDTHDDRGTGRSEGAGAPAGDPDEWHSYGLGGLYSYGAKGAKGRLEVEAGFLSKEYDNNRAVTYTRDRDNADLGATFYYQIMPKTALLFQAANTDIDYDQDAPGTASLDSDEWRYLVGATWEATFQTTGTVKVGRLRKDFNDGAREDFSGSSWELGMQWRPLSYSSVDIISSKKTGETDGSGDYILTKDLSVSWTHGWFKRFSTTANIYGSEASYGASAREDDTLSYGLSADYQMRRWLSFGASYTRTEKDSNTNTFDYDKNIFLLSVTATL